MLEGAERQGHPRKAVLSVLQTPHRAWGQGTRGKLVGSRRAHGRGWRDEERKRETGKSWQRKGSDRGWRRNYFPGLEEGT